MKGLSGQWLAVQCLYTRPLGMMSRHRACRQHMRTCSNAKQECAKAQGLLALLPLAPKIWGSNLYFMWPLGAQPII